MKKPKLIMLNGFAGSGKTTLKNRYLRDHGFTLGFEGDVFITMLAGWKDNWTKATELKNVHTKKIVATHLQAGYDVVLPFLLEDHRQAEEYSDIAQSVEATFYEIYLELDKEDAVRRLYTRGCWGEEGSEPLIEDDRPEVEALFERMEEATRLRPDTVRIKPVESKIEETYQAMLRAIGE